VLAEATSKPSIQKGDDKVKVGLDQIPLGPLFKWDNLQLMEHAVEYGYEGVLFSARSLVKDEAYRQQVIERAHELNLYLELGGGRIDTALSGKSVKENVQGWKPLFDIAAEAGSKILTTGLGVWPWEGRVKQDPGQSVQAQIEGGIATLQALRPLAEQHGIAISIHSSHFTADEYLQIVQAVDSPYVGLCLDTANAFLAFQDPVAFAQQVAPWVKSTHLKDSVIYLQSQGLDWLGGCPLGRGQVDLPAIVDLLYQANPELNLSIEDHWGRMTMPIFDSNFLDSFEWHGAQVTELLRFLYEGQKLLAAGLFPTAEESNEIDWKQVFPERAKYNAAYAKRLRDEVVERYQSGEKP
jgi:sugar phosphate isomerase/epimerase